MTEFGTMLRPTPTTSVLEWASAWSKCYSYVELDAKYKTGLGQLKDSTDDSSLQAALGALFEWKNGGNLSGRKQRAVEGITFEIWSGWKARKTIPEHFKSGAVWNIFLAHLLSDGKRPIFDQHTWRACCALTAIQYEELGEMRTRKRYDAYSQYELWFNTMVAELDPRILDRALMAYGQFLSSQFRPLLELPAYMNADEFLEESVQTTRK